MPDSAFDPPERRRRVPVLLIALGAIGVAKAAAWFHFRNQQPITDEITRDRLQKRGDA